MDLEDRAPWAEAFAAYCARFDDLFVRSESRAQARKYLRGRKRASICAGASAQVSARAGRATGAQDELAARRGGARYDA
jgi:hypothetical protein